MYNIHIYYINTCLSCMYIHGCPGKQTTTQRLSLTMIWSLELLEDYGGSPQPSTDERKIMLLTATRTASKNG